MIDALLVSAMNPLCCIAPVSIDRDRANPVVEKSVNQSQLGLEGVDKSLNNSSKPTFSAQVSSVGTDLDRFAGLGNQDDEELVAEARDSKAYSVNGSVSGAVAGILYKWVNYGKGWRSRWFVLEDGVLSYYKIHGPDKILMSPAREKDVRVIGEESLRYMRKANWTSNRLGVTAASAVRQCKPFGEIHLKVCFFVAFYRRVK